MDHGAAPRSEDVLRRIEADRDRYLAELIDFLRIRSISADPAYHDEVVKGADFVVSKLRDAGLVARRIDGKGKPLVYGEHLEAGPGKPTVLFYGHYDVQPADPLELWESPPFEPTIKGDCLVARGATDDKGQSYAHVKAIEAILRERGRLPVNVKFLIEGEEESGGEAIEAYVREDGGRTLACDCVFISDSAMYAPGQPSLVYGLKGLAYLELRVHGPDRDLHSGSFGGTVRNPGNALAHLVSRLQDPVTGRLRVPGFYDDVRPLADWERREFASLPFDEETFRRDLHVPALFGEEGYSSLERRWARPTCDVNGLFGGYMEAGAKTIIPSWAGAKVSMRLVPDQDPQKVAALVESFLRSELPSGVRLEVTFHHGAKPVLLAAQGPIVDAVLAGVEDEWKRPVRVREGGSIPIVSTFDEVLKVPILLLGFGLEDDRLHSPNEKFNLSHFFGGIRATARVLDRLGEVERPARP